MCTNIKTKHKSKSKKKIKRKFVNIPQIFFYAMEFCKYTTWREAKIIKKTKRIQSKIKSLGKLFRVTSRKACEAR